MALPFLLRQLKFPQGLANQPLINRELLLLLLMTAVAVCSSFPSCFFVHLSIDQLNPVPGVGLVVQLQLPLLDFCLAQFRSEDDVDINVK